MQDFVVGFPTLSRYDLLQEAVNGVNESELKPKLIYICDNGVGSPEIKSEIPIAYIHNPYNYGVSATWNQLWDLAGKDKLFIINDDMRVAKNTFEVMLNAGTDIVEGHGYSLFLVTPELRAKVGDFDERFWPAYWEDIDYGLRVARSEATIAKLTFDDIQHLENGSATYHHNPWMKVYLHENKHRMYRKWGLTEAEEAKMRIFQPFYAHTKPIILDPFEEYMQYGRHLPKTYAFGQILLKWLGF